jgi:hypothetical protein
MSAFEKVQRNLARRAQTTLTQIEQALGATEVTLLL